MPTTPNDAATPRRRTTIYDIARTAGVSAAAVSLALNQPGRLSADSERRILAVADELGYRANPFARAVATGTTQLIGLLVHDSANPVFAGAVRGVTDAAARVGYTVVVSDTHDLATPVTTILERLLPLVDGAVSCSARVTPEALAGVDGTPIVLVNREVAGRDSVIPDVGAATRAAIELLVGRGHRDLGFIAGPQDSWLSRYRLALLEREVAASTARLQVVASVEPTIDGGRDALAQLEGRCTAVLTFNDLIAFGVLLQARDRGLRVPEDLSVVGFDDTFAAMLVTPALTTISTELEPASRLATVRLLAALGHPNLDPDARIEGRLTVRDSVGAGPHR
ncbi:LacI family DNA-binding transcriptional regulator [Occultella kanbiaonis]|uniref:LacI family DNA-binding transcriptional regulator n=1 Tax=Occultella kanbiaonis TaxID=2675754 RepID=UPI0013D220FA|nr:LacI family DNA-binding transcriptional regulator [Occultella kanbiaonis]